MTTENRKTGALLTQRQAAAALGVSPATIRAMMRTGQIETVRVGKLLRVPQAAVSAWAGPRKVEGAI
jgi:excisionase family DNA binding protein